MRTSPRCSPATTGRRGYRPPVPPLWALAVALGVAFAAPGAALAHDGQTRGPSICARGAGPVTPADNAPADPIVGPLPADRLARFVLRSSLPEHRSVPIWAEADGERPGHAAPLEHPPRPA